MSASRFCNCNNNGNSNYNDAANSGGYVRPRFECRTNDHLSRANIKGNLVLSEREISGMMPKDKSCGYIHVRKGVDLYF